MMQRHSNLLELKNLGAASVNILYAIGIHSGEELRQVGAVEAYNRIRARGIQVSKVMLYALEGALCNVHWNQLDADLKSQLLEQADLAEADLPET